MFSGDRIIGNSTAGMDYFRITTAGGTTPGIYRNRLVLSSPNPSAGHDGWIRGLNQTGTGSTYSNGQVLPGSGGTPGANDVSVQLSSTITTPIRFVQWYTFGRNADIYYRVQGDPTTFENYTAALETISVAPTSIGTFVEGSINIKTVGQGHTTDTDLWVLDSNFDPVPGFGNDDTWTSSGAISFQSSLTRTYVPGTYYLAISNDNVATNLGSPPDERSLVGNVLDFAGSLANSSPTSGVNVSFAITDSGGTPAQISSTKLGAYDVNYYRFTVAPVPEPATLATLGLGILAVLRRRKRVR